MKERRKEGKKSRKKEEPFVAVRPRTREMREGRGEVGWKGGRGISFTFASPAERTIRLPLRLSSMSFVEDPIPSVASPNLLMLRFADSPSEIVFDRSDPGFVVVSVEDEDEED
jgi:hypothetical protein